MDNTSFAPGNNSINNSAPPLTPQYSSPEPKHLPKLVTWVVLILALGFVGYAGIWYWQDQQVGEDYPVLFTPRPSATPDPTADWKTYTNTQYGFEFKYPNDFVITESSTADTNPNTRIYIVNIKKQLEGDEYQKISFSYSPQINLELSSEPSYKPEGPPAYIGGATWDTDRFNDGSPGQGALYDSLLIDTEYGGKFYSITLYPNDGPEINPAFEEILATFKFIK
ncbi:MAG: hypothetical protein A2735_02275 [Candidatus Yanofskybacteria bacterium RIFCSPHIGHO2_01_FULL_41_21]|uniref:Uncharacterized protein n=1 Tax=Candidatus Yanofskybacteria bacterium RIFCSPHIGHO2_01_FULL_41_21 TaxID=1802660 RepID=A0A1F8EAM3_9BACT|nr:MAG: hypothetical protein A2735_02275 [Candidatus Yanofskybacteria bacterium RIFCSPHIGHO2_01_FULL_41_21]